MLKARLLPKVRIENSHSTALVKCVEIQCVMSVPANHSQTREVVLGFYDMHQEIVCKKVDVID
jgi:hypothetical protein